MANKKTNLSLQKVCFDVRSKTSLMLKLYKVNGGSKKEINDLIEKTLSEVLSKKLKEKGIHLEVDDIPCPSCNLGVLVERKGKTTPFLGCSKYPTCKYTKKIL